jgi:hypothetical protein
MALVIQPNRWGEKNQKNQKATAGRAAEEGGVAIRAKSGRQGEPRAVERGDGKKSQQRQEAGGMALIRLGEPRVGIPA